MKLFQGWEAQDYLNALLAIGNGVKGALESAQEMAAVPEGQDPTPEQTAQWRAVSDSKHAEHQAAVAAVMSRANGDTTNAGEIEREGDED